MKPSNVLPSISQNNIVDCSMVNTKPISNLSLIQLFRIIKMPNLYNLFFSKFCASALSAVRHKDSIFLSRIAHVIFVGTKKKVLWIYTWWIVAFMTYQKSGWNFTKVYFPRHPVCPQMLIIVLNHPISKMVCVANPKPTRIRFVNFFKKSISNWCLGSSGSWHRVVPMGAIIA